MSETHPFLDHLEELRRRIFYSLITLAVAAVVAFFFSDRVLELLTRPVPKLVFLSPSEAFVVKLKVALASGLFLAAPLIFYQFWRFVRPALLRHEVKYVVWAVAVSTVFFLGGVGFAYFIVVPVAMKFLLSFATPKLEPMLSIDRYFSTVAAFLLACGVVFQLPVVSFFLTKLGIITPRTLVKQHRIAIVVIFVVAAILSPPDVFSQILMAIPLFVLYEASILASFLARSKPKQAGG
ncbi:MAG: twin-arginine translocase subunit TatC [candidate division WOR-3 bacterium]